MRVGSLGSLCSGVGVLESVLEGYGHPSGPGRQGPGPQPRGRNEPARSDGAPTDATGHGLDRPRCSWGGRTGPVDSDHAPTDADRERQQGGPESDLGPPGRLAASRRADPDRCGVPVEWGAYGPAVRRWETIHGPAPDPLDDRGRLNPPFVEWMMGLPAGWVTDQPIARTHQLRLLGNSIVPHAADAAWRHLNARAVA